MSRASSQSPPISLTVATSIIPDQTQSTLVSELDNTINKDDIQHINNKLIPLHRILKILASISPSESNDNKSILRVQTGIQPVHEYLKHGINKTIDNLNNANDCIQQLNILTQQSENVENDITNNNNNNNDIDSIRHESDLLESKYYESFNNLGFQQKENEYILALTSPSLYVDIPVNRFCQLERVFVSTDKDVKATKVHVWCDIPLGQQTFSYQDRSFSTYTPLESRIYDEMNNNSQYTCGDVLFSTIEQQSKDSIELAQQIINSRIEHMNLEQFNNGQGDINQNNEFEKDDDNQNDDENMSDNITKNESINDNTIDNNDDTINNNNDDNFTDLTHLVSSGLIKSFDKLQTYYHNLPQMSQNYRNLGFSRHSLAQIDIMKNLSSLFSKKLPYNVPKIPVTPGTKYYMTVYKSTSRVSNNSPLEEGLTTHTIAQSEVSDNYEDLLRFMGYTFDYQYITIGFTFLIKPSIEARIFKICKISLNDQQSKSILPYGVPGSDNEHYNKYIPYRNDGKPPHMFISPLPEAKWLLEIRGLSVGLTTDSVKSDIRQVTELLSKYLE